MDKITKFEYIEFIEAIDGMEFNIDTKVINKLLNIITNIEYTDLMEYKGFKDQNINADVIGLIMDFKSGLDKIRIDILNKSL